MPPDPFSNLSNLTGDALTTLLDFGRRFEALTSIADPGKALLEAAYLKGMISVLGRLGMFDPSAVADALKIIELTVTATFDKYLPWADADVQRVLPTLRDELRKL